MKVYDNYEISPCRRFEEPDSPGKFYFEVCAPEEVAVWTLYGHINGEGVEAIGDFATRDAAEQVYARITGQPFTGSYKADTHLRVMYAGPKLLEALQYQEMAHADPQAARRKGYYDEATRLRRAAIAEATGSSPPEPRKPIVIEVRGGIVQDVFNVPPGFEYEVKDYDNIEADEQAAAEQEDGITRPSPLPPDPEGMNDKRSAWAAKAIAAFQQETGVEDEDALADLLADLMHWADRSNYDFDATMDRARFHYIAETGGEEAA